MTCSFPFCSRPVPKEGMCFLHAAKYGKQKPIPKKSEKRKKIDAEYSKIKKQMMSESSKCEAKLDGCTKIAVDLHHIQGRGKELTTKRENLLRVCRSCHSQIELKPLLAINLGLSKSRHKLSKEKQKAQNLPQK